ncbi:hypothetical protein LTR84_004562 [Exophiala bonariae]|uniref:WLM domain-containing protein n=1 Tax=Exophiala bonariae TaxID=1690606 RepID=A0AAV9NQ00_9EURO|nr:hypothetical protein LTR84_004562 [Exophiala bonariae]
MSRGNNARDLDPLIDQFQHLKDKKRAGEALQMLRKIASIVKPIMRQHNWRVGTLCEFYPAQHNLLGLNRNAGERIELRLRYPGDENQFLPIEQIIDTMLHELSHIVHGPHDQQFHALWDKLRDEHAALVAKGYTGEGFLGRGDRLGGKRVPMGEMRRRARAAAEQRAVRTKNSGSVLGGAGVLRGQHPRDAIAAAAEKRAQAERGCANGTDEGRKIAEGLVGRGGQVTTTKAGQEDENEAAWIQAMIELVREDEAGLFNQDHMDGADGYNNPNPTAAAVREEQANLERMIKKQSRSQSKPTPAAPAKPTPQTWTCDICTLINPIEDLMCGACETERPSNTFPTTFAPPPPPASSGRNTTRPSSAAARKTDHHTNTHTSPTALQPRLNANDSIARIESQAAMARKKARPMGWTCRGCGNWMEEMWWTCAACGTMKASS